ncbi:hypothetical protein CIHG_06419 [Coccidioides immitis H538.4]|uniref:SMI1/KNR4 family protein n=1 Tax=Coccidioides immitis H538.4 TaxID=396776 RepID=A0A0J8RVZ6_COCIT|nr:hypothetical protein CIHG_06419 [Coccidioides immitis H538.4]
MTPTTDFDLQTALAACQDSPPARWAFIRQFTRSWASTGTLNNTQAPADANSTEIGLAAGEQRLKLTLPPALKEAYKLLGHRPDLTSNHDRFLAPEELYIHQHTTTNDISVLVFRTENQNAAIWGIKICHFSNPDPPVFIRLGLSEEEAEQWLPWTATFSEALVEIILTESMFDPTALTYISFEECGRSELEKRFTPLPFPRYSPESGSTISWFTHGPNLLLRHDGSEVMIRARTDDAVQRLTEQNPDLFSNLVPNGYI